MAALISSMPKYLGDASVFNFKTVDRLPLRFLASSRLLSHNSVFFCVTLRLKCFLDLSLYKIHKCEMGTKTMPCSILFHLLDN